MCSTMLFCFNIISIKMTQYNTLNVKLSNYKLNKLKSGKKDNTEVTLKISSNIAGDSNNENNFMHKLLLKFLKAFANCSPANIKLSKIQMHKIGQSGGFLGRLLGPLLKVGLPFIENVLKTLAKSVLIPLVLTAAASVTDPAIHKKNIWTWLSSFRLRFTSFGFSFT